MWEGNNNTFTEEQLSEKVEAAVNKYKSDSEAWVQKLVNEWKFKDSVLDWVWKVAADSEALIEIFEWDSNVWQEILDKYYWGQTIEEYKSSINYAEAPEQLNDKLINKRATAIYNDNKYDEVVGEFISMMWLEWDKLTEFNTEMSERKAMSSYDPKKLKTYIKKSYKYVTGNSWDEIDKIKSVKNISKAGNIDAGTNKGDGKDNSTATEVKNFLKQHLD